jgi:hypothetical protein
VTSPAKPHLIPLWIKLAYTAFMAVLIPVYLYHYGPTNFLYFCDVAAVMTLIAVWLESPFLASAALVGIFVPQMVWVVDFFAELFGKPLTGLTNYMFDQQKPFYLRFLSFFHFWLPFLLMFLVKLLGYDRRGAFFWAALALVLMPVCFFFMPEPGAYADANIPQNINYVYGFSEKSEQTIMPRYVYFALVMVVLPVGVLLPTHLFFAWLMPKARAAA